MAYQSPSFVYPYGTFEFQGMNGNYNNVFQGVQPNMYAGISANISASAPQANFNIVANSAWYIDSRATNHVTHDVGIFSQYSVYNCAKKPICRKWYGIVYLQYWICYHLDLNYITCLST